MSLRRELLLGFLLGALENEEREQVERELAANPRLREELGELAAVVAKLGLNDPPEPIEPPAELAERTCQFVEAQAQGLGDVALPPDRSPAAETGGYTLTDAVVAAAVLLVLSALVFPSLANSQVVANINSCQNNLRQLGYAMWNFSEFDSMRRYPALPANTRLAIAGAIPSRLLERGMLPTPDIVVCRASDQSRFTPNYPLATESQLQIASEEEFERLRPFVGGSYSFPVGYTVSGQIVPACNQYRENYCLVADLPLKKLAPSSSVNHDGRGGNFFFEDGHIRWIVASCFSSLPDDPYCNRHGQIDPKHIGAGSDPDDAVLGCKDLRPVPAIRPIAVETR